MILTEISVQQRVKKVLCDKRLDYICAILLSRRCNMHAWEAIQNSLNYIVEPTYVD